MTGVVARYMSSTYAIDSAWDMLHSDDKIEKIAPFIIPAAMALYGGLQGYKNVKDNKVTDPFLGIKVGEGDDSFGSNLAEFGTGVAQGFVPGGLLGVGAKRAGGKVAAKHGAKNVAARRAQEEARERAARDLAATRLQRVKQRPGDYFDPRVSYSHSVPKGLDDKLYQEALTDSYATSIGSQAYTAAGGGPATSRLAGGLTAMSKPGMKRGLAGGAALGAAGVVADKAPGLLAGALGAYGMSKLPQAPTTGFGASQMGTTGAAPTQGTPVSGNADPYALRSIYQNEQWDKDNQFGGHGVSKGDNMFRKNIGEELLNEAAYRLHKAHCGTELKADCPKDCKGCPECDGDDKKKADDKKKPAHGMVIVIGSKAGPGPSKDGKREKLDSEKKKE